MSYLRLRLTFTDRQFYSKMEFTIPPWPLPRHFPATCSVHLSRVQPRFGTYQPLIPRDLRRLFKSVDDHTTYTWSIMAGFHDSRRRPSTTASKVMSVLNHSLPRRLPPLSDDLTNIQYDFSPHPLTTHLQRINLFLVFYLLLGRIQV